MLPCSLWSAWSVPSSVKGRRAANWASTRFDREEFVGLQATSTLFAAARVPTRWHFFAVRCGEKMSQTMAIRASVG